MNKLFLEDPCCLFGKTEITFKLNTGTEQSSQAKPRVLRMVQVMLPGLLQQHPNPKLLLSSTDTSHS